MIPLKLIIELYLITKITIYLKGYISKIQEIHHQLKFSLYSLKD
jgi:hypothetical protein